MTVGVRPALCVCDASPTTQADTLPAAEAVLHRGYSFGAQAFGDSNCGKTDKVQLELSKHCVCDAGLNTVFSVWVHITVSC